ncbi:expressed conserved protein [Echinococcus multilocularis]|uniref:Expressed conserved protein n=1 Tax=Echinococcus multilocularis TaxID=6211 RepID=A0A087VZ12_ECHMU|nr:expressed conserved protein [Echinococcus multilocularis]
MENMSSSHDRDVLRTAAKYCRKPNVVVTEKRCCKKIITVMEDKPRRRSRSCERKPCKSERRCRSREKSTCRKHRSSSKRRRSCHHHSRCKSRHSDAMTNVRFCTTVATKDCDGKLHTYSKCYTLPICRDRC